MPPCCLRAFRALAVLSALSALASADDLILPPIRHDGPPAALVFAQGAQVAPELYRPLMLAVQQRSAASLWVAVPQNVGNLPNPVTLGSAIEAVVAKMRDQGMANDTALFYGGHSLGTVMIQDYSAQNTSNAKGQLLVGGFLSRKHNYPAFSYPVPTLTVGGELDGLARVTRTVGEAYYHQIALADNETQAVGDFPVVVVKGMNHWQAASGTPTSFVHMFDLVAAIDADTAHNTTGGLFADFLDFQLGVAGAGRTVAAAVQTTTKEFVGPIIQAYEKEGSRHFNAPRQYGGPGEAACVRGGCPDSSSWAVEGQQVVAGQVEGFQFNITNEFVKLAGSPASGADFHLPSIYTDNTTHVVSVSTYSQGKWEMLDNEDTGITFTSARELGTKMASRQCILSNATAANVSFSVDDPNFCMQANQNAYQFALSVAGDETLQRFRAFGEPFVFAPDISKIGGPWWVYSSVQFNKVTTVNGTAAVEVASPMLKTEKDYWEDHFHIPRPSWIPDPGCYHYCKLLSPARALEWVYVDSLRAELSNASVCENCVANGQSWCWVDGKCHDSGDKGSPCSAKQCAGTGCVCSACMDPQCAQQADAAALDGAEDKAEEGFPLGGSARGGVRGALLPHSV